MGPASVPSSTWFEQPTSTPPSAGQVKIYGAPAGSGGPSGEAVSAQTWGSFLSATTPATIDGSAGTGPTAAQMADPRCHVSNYGMADSDQYSQLPTAAENLSCLFSVDAARAHKWGVKAGTNDNVTILAADGTIGTAGADNGYARMTAAQIGQEFACWSWRSGASTFDWRCKAISIGTSAFAAN